MEFKTYGDPRNDSVFLIHDVGLNPAQYEMTAKELSRSFFVVLPELDGHGASDVPFTNIADQARQIMEYIDTRRQGSTLLVGGSGLGADIALTIISHRPFMAAYALLDGLTFGENPTYPFFIHRRYHSLERNRLLLEHMGRLADRSVISAAAASMREFQLPEVTSLRSKVLIVYGGRSSRATKRSAVDLFRSIDDSVTEEMEGMSHGELSLENPGRLAILIYQLVRSLT